MELRGWVELDGRNLTNQEVAEILASAPRAVTRFGGEFLLSWGGCTARDHFGIIPGPVPAGTICCSGEEIGEVLPLVPDMPLGDAIIQAVRFRSGEGICAFSGGVDSALIAQLAERPCVAVGLAGSHDLSRARYVAGRLDLSCTYIEITPDDVREGLAAVIRVIPEPTPVNTAIAVTQYLITRSARELGHERVISGQGADELFGGYARYRSGTETALLLERDFAGLPAQARRDQSVAALNGTYLSLPYLDLRVVRAARLIPPGEMVKNGVGKWPLRVLAGCHLPAEITFHPKKAMQYGTGVAAVIRQFSRHNGYNRSLQGYLDQIRMTGGRVEE